MNSDFLALFLDILVDMALFIAYNISSVVPRSIFLVDTGVPLPDFRGTFTNSGTHTKSFKFLPIKLNSNSEISVHFLFKFELLMSIVLAREGV